MAHEIRNEPAEAVPATAQLFLINPPSGEGMDNLFSTHPSTANRIAELEKLAAEMGVRGRTVERGAAPRPAGRAWEGPHGPWG